MWVILGLLVVGGIVVYRRQRPDRKEAIKRVAARWVSSSLKRLPELPIRCSKRVSFSAPMSYWPRAANADGAVLRELAIASNQMSAWQLCEALDDSVRPAVGSLRAFLHANKVTVFG